jgi:hypothetical protein
MTWVDVTDKVAYGAADDGCLPLLRCLCGEPFEAWAFVLGVHPDLAMPCPACGRQYYFGVRLHVYASPGADDAPRPRRRRRRRRTSGVDVAEGPDIPAT